MPEAWRCSFPISLCATAGIGQVLHIWPKVRPLALRLPPLPHPILRLMTSLLVFSPDSLEVQLRVPHVVSWVAWVSFAVSQHSPGILHQTVLSLDCQGLILGPFLSGPLTHSFRPTSLCSHLAHHQPSALIWNYSPPSPPKCLQTFLVTSLHLSSPTYSPQ